MLKYSDAGKPQRGAQAGGRDDESPARGCGVLRGEHDDDAAPGGRCFCG